MGLGPVYIQAHKSLGRPVFTAMMSKSARTILDTVLQALVSRGVEMGGANPLLQTFANDFSAIVYEDAALGWSHKELLAKIKGSVLMKTRRQTTPEELVSVARLTPLYNREWDIPSNPHGGHFRLSHSASQIDIYNHITTQFLLDDFSDYDVLKLIELVRSNTIEEIQEACQHIDAPEKKNIQYLYKVIKNTEVANAVTTTEVKSRLNESMRVMADMLKIAQGPKFPCEYDPDWTEDAKASEAMRTGIWID